MSTKDMETEEAPTPADGEDPSTSAPPESETGGSRSSKKRPRSPAEPESASTAAPVSAASAATAAQLSATMGLNGLYSLLSATALSSSANLPTVEQVQQAAEKSLLDAPPFVHFSKTDSAPQLKVLDDKRRLHLKGGMRGYRMSRATQGISEGHYYYEVLILEPPKVSEIVDSLPSTVRLSPKLSEQMDIALKLEKAGEPSDPNGFGAHVRVGFSNRTGDLQAPVGYDKWSYGVRDIGGSKIHQSKRDDAWGGETFGPGDVIGCAISLVNTHEGNESGTDDGPIPGPGAAAGNKSGTTASGSGKSKGEDDVDLSSSENHIRFFKNGQPMGKFVLSMGKREGGIAFHVAEGVYYPAVSLYMGASVRFNPGPHFMCPPRKLPAGLRFKPVSSLCPPPQSIEKVLAKVQKEKPFRKADMLNRFQELVTTEMNVLKAAYEDHRRKHVEEVMQERTKRSLKKDDLEKDEYFTAMEES